MRNGKRTAHEQSENTFSFLLGMFVGFTQKKLHVSRRSAHENVLVYLLCYVFVLGMTINGTNAKTRYTLHPSFRFDEGCKKKVVGDKRHKYTFWCPAPLVGTGGLAALNLASLLCCRVSVVWAIALRKTGVGPVGSTKHYVWQLSVPTIAMRHRVHQFRFSS